MFDCFRIVHWLFSCQFFKFTSHYPRCCEYALLVLEYWADAPEIQRSADLYQDMIKCCVADAMSEVGSIFYPMVHNHGMFIFALKWSHLSKIELFFILYSHTLDSSLFIVS
jgi:hypothetical protein